MHILCKQELLLNSINTAIKACSTKTTMPILQCILIKAYNNQVTLVGYNLELGIESTVDAEVIEEGSIALEAKIFSEIIRKMPNEMVELSTSTNQMTKIICEECKFSILGQVGESFPDLPIVKKSIPYTLPQHTLKEMIRQTIFSVALEESRPMLTGEMLQVKEGYFRMISFDGYRISYRQITLPTEYETQEVIVPGRTLNEVSKILSSDETHMMNLYFEDNNVLFDLGECKVVSRLVEGEFLKYEQVFSADYATYIEVDCKKFLRSIERAALISREGKRPIKLEIDADNLIITSKAELGTVHEKIDIELKGNEISIGFNPKFLIEALKCIDDERICLHFISPLAPCTINPIHGTHYKYLILPVRLG